MPIDPMAVAGLVATVVTPLLAVGGKRAVAARADKRDKKTVYDWLYNNSGPNGDMYDISTKEISAAVKLSTERVRYICDNHPEIKPSRVADSWRVHEPETLIRYI